ncbi:MAG: M15 family metallopeptidase, partial [Leptolyngbyaceae cyanobacterium SM1_3_5]|nr:M15 family metallopeptidase [Leptolyngbyaceae cyanobacterium SM1_3_5]
QSMNTQPESHPDYLADRSDAKSIQFHAHRQLLRQIMVSIEFRQHPNEWWHFSFGDQMWAWLGRDQSEPPLVARYGAV